MNRFEDRVPSLWPAVVISVAACALAVFGSLTRPVWHDELYTLYLARLPIAELIEALRLDSGPPLHYLVCRLLFAVFGWSEGSPLGTFMVRLPSVVAFAAIPFVLQRVRPSIGSGFPWPSLLAIAWLPLLYFGTEARAYAILALANTVVWVLGPEWVERGGFRTVFFATVAAMLPLLHYTGYVSLAVSPFLGFFIARRRRPALWFALAVAALPALFWLPVMLTAPEASMSWVVTGSGPGRPGLSTVHALAPAGPFPALFGVFRSPVPAWLSVGLLIVLVSGVLVGALRRCQRSDEDSGELKLAARLALGSAPVVVVAVMAVAGMPVYFAGRTESQGWALAVAAGGLLLTGLSVLARRVVAGSYALVGLVTITLWLGDLPFRASAPGVEVGRKLASMIETGDRVVVAGLWQLEVRHGLAAGWSGGDLPFAVETIPRSQALHPGWLDREALIATSLLGEARALEQEARQSGERVWLIWSPSLPLDSIFFPAFGGWRRTSFGDSPIIAVDLLSR